MEHVPRVSVLLPTRGRSALCLESMQSLRATASSPEEIEFIIRRDHDDAADYSGMGAFNARVLVGQGLGYTGLHTYYNDCAQVSRGAWLLIWNDDAVMRTEAWDDVLTADPNSVWLMLAHKHFPAIAHQWYSTCGRLSASPHLDTYVCHVLEYMIDKGVHTSTYEADVWDVWHRCDEIDDEGSQRRKHEILGPDGTSAKFFSATMRAEIIADAEKIMTAMKVTR